MAVRGNAGALRPVKIDFHPYPSYQRAMPLCPSQRRASATFANRRPPAFYWDTVPHKELPGMNEAQAFAGWSGERRHSAMIAGPGPHAVIYRRDWLTFPDAPAEIHSPVPRGLILPNFPQRALPAVIDADRDGLVSDAFWLAWELAGGRDRHSGARGTVGDARTQAILQVALRLGLLFPDEPCFAPLRSLPVF